MRSMKPASLFLLIALALLTPPGIHSQQYSQQLDPNLYSGLRWRMIGPFRGGRANAGRRGLAMLRRMDRAAASSNQPTAAQRGKRFPLESLLKVADTSASRWRLQI